jgi:hypothetical protein
VLWVKVHKLVNKGRGTQFANFASGTSTYLPARGVITTDRHLKAEDRNGLHFRFAEDVDSGYVSEFVPGLNLTGLGWGFVHPQVPYTQLSVLKLYFRLFYSCFDSLFLCPVTVFQRRFKQRFL